MMSGNRIGIWLGGIVILLALMIPVGAQAQGEGCTKSGCHDKMSTKKWVHGPVGVGICTVCHTETDKKNHKFELVTDEQSLCFTCHEDKQEQMMSKSHLHTPVASGECTGCHDPHQSDYRYQLYGEGSELCFNCHDTDQFKRDFQHGPVAVGACNACHDPHASNNEFQLTSPRKRICYQCHPDKESQVNSRHPHPPVKEDCTNCHDPHSQVARYMMAEEYPKICFKCHSDVEKKMSSPTPHPPLAEGKCYECHQVHGSENPVLFSLPQEKMCFSCHTKMAEFINNSKYRHGPVKDGDCIACHDGHGSEQPFILRQYFPRKFYNAFSVEKYALCFNCHNKDIALDSVTLTLTDFRNYDINLHYKHVNKQYKGRSCKACHEVHASNQAKHIRKEVPFGKNWSYPIIFTKYDDGGKCVVGCHKPQAYKRQMQK